MDCSRRVPAVLTRRPPIAFPGACDPGFRVTKGFVRNAVLP